MPTQHTPGPWRFFEPTGLEITPGRSIKADDEVLTPIAIALIGQGASPKGQAQQKANARLIAAAPELLAALQAAEGAVSFARDNCVHSNSADAQMLVDLGKIRAAILKATNSTLTANPKQP